MAAKKALVFLAEGYEEIETVCPIDILRRGEVEVTVASISNALLVQGRSNIFMQADVVLDSVVDNEYDCIVVPGGPGTKLLREDSRVLNIVKKHVDSGKIVAAICAAPTVLKQAGVLPAKYTAHQSVADALPEIRADESVVIDGRIITSRGAGTAVEFGLKIVQELVSKDKADAIQKAIHFF